MEVICANRGIMFSDQPFGIYTASSANINRLPVFPYGQIAYPDDDEQQVLARLRRRTPERTRSERIFPGSYGAANSIFSTTVSA